jgi:hypothetical protein
MSLESDTLKRLHGQFFTITNPFNVDAFHKWFKSIEGYASLDLLEPFAGSNNIVCMLQDLGYSNPWHCFDIAPVNTDENASGVLVQQRDTLALYPEGYRVAITNPPYLAKNSATRRGLPFPETDYDDLYKVALSVMLAKTDFVAAIIPESFLTQNLFHNRLHAVVSLTCRMFEDTEVPVCLALFVPAERKSSSLDFELYSENRFIGRYSELKSHLSEFDGPGLPMKFNSPTGVIGLFAIDNQTGPSIRFVEGKTIDPEQVKHTSRSVTRIEVALTDAQAKKVIHTANQLLNKQRDLTKDAFLTAFKGLRKDGRYRRRLDFSQARNLLNLAAKEEGLV